MPAMETLLALERRFWLEGADFYRQQLSEECMMLLPGVGLLGRAEAIAGIESGQRWSEVAMKNEQTLELGPATRLLCYEVKARREEGPDYRALVSSVYVRRADTWKLAFHHQSHE